MAARDYADREELLEELERLQRRVASLEDRQRRADKAMVAVLEYHISDWAEAVEKARAIVSELRQS